MKASRIVLPEGSFTIPVAYEDVTTALVVIPLPLERLGALVPSKWSPQRLVRNDGGLVLYFVDAKKTGFGSYREMAIGVLCNRPSDEGAWGDDLDWCPPPIFPAWFAVSAPLPLAGGQLAWGFNKVLATTTLDVTASSLICAIGSRAERWLRFDCRLPSAQEEREVGLRSLTLVNGRHCETRVKGPALFGQADGVEFSLEVDERFPARDLLAGVPARGEAISTFLLTRHKYELDWPLGSGEP